MKYDVHVTRTGFSSGTIQVVAKNQEEATQKALEAAGNLDFSEHDADYAVESVSPAGPTM